MSSTLLPSLEGLAARRVTPRPVPDQVARQRIAEVDGLRGLAIASVIVWHYIACLWKPMPKTWPSYIARSFTLSWSGVDLFFVLSGFLIGGILLDTRLGAHYFRRFYLRRALRIVPLYFLMIACMGMAS